MRPRARGGSITSLQRCLGCQDDLDLHHQAAGKFSAPHVCSFQPECSQVCRQQTRHHTAGDSKMCRHLFKATTKLTCSCCQLKSGGGSTEARSTAMLSELVDAVFVVRVVGAGVGRVVDVGHARVGRAGWQGPCAVKRRRCIRHSWFWFIKKWKALFSRPS